MLSTFQDLIEKRRRQWSTLSMLALAQVIVLTFGLISTSLMARFLPVEVFGHYQVILSLMAVVGIFCLSGLYQSMAISAAKRYDGNLVSILRLKIGANLVGSLVVVGVGVYYYFSGQTVLAFGVMIAALFFPFRLEKMWLSWLNARNKLFQAAYSKAAIVGIGLITTIIVILLPPITLTKTILWFFSLPAIYTAGLVVYMLRSRENNIKDEPTIKYGLHVAAASLLVALIDTDKLIINEFISVTDVAVYSIALIFPKQLGKVFDVFDQFIAPKIYKADSVKDAWRYFKPKFFLLCLLFTLIGLVGFMGLPILVPFFFSERYVEAVPLSKWLWLTYALGLPTMYLGNIVMSQQKVRFAYIFLFAAPVSRFMMYFLFLPLGISGIVLATALNYVFNGIIRILGFMYYLYFPHSMDKNQEV